MNVIIWLNISLKISNFLKAFLETNLEKKPTKEVEIVQPGSFSKVGLHGL